MAASPPSFHLVNYPAGAGYATVHAATTAGTVRISAAAGGAVRESEVRPLSPVYNLNNTAAAQLVTIPLGEAAGPPEVVAVTFVNDSTGPADVSVAVGVSYLPAANQQQPLTLADHTTTADRQVPNGGSTFFHIVFNRVG